MTGNDADIYYVYDRYVAATIQNPGYPKVDDLSFPLNGVNSYPKIHPVDTPHKSVIWGMYATGDSN